MGVEFCQKFILHLLRIWPHDFILHNRRHTWRLECTWLQYKPRGTVLTLPCLPQTAHYILLWFPKGSFLSQLISPLWRDGFSEYRKISPHLQPPTRVSGPFFDSFSFFFFSFFHLPDCKGIFLVLLFVWSLPQMFSRCSVRTVPFIDVFWMCLWGERNSASSIPSSWHLLSTLIFVCNMRATEPASALFSGLDGIRYVKHLAQCLIYNNAQ